MASKILASLTAVIGAVGVAYSLLAAFGVDLSRDQQDAITGALGIVLVVAGIWLHPDIPLGVRGGARALVTRELRDGRRRSRSGRGTSWTSSTQPSLLSRHPHRHPRLHRHRPSTSRVGIFCSR